MTLPTLHMNGTGANMLMEGYENAWVDVRDAQDTLGKIEFNPRDYYVQDGAWEKAIEERRDIFQLLKRVEDYLMAHMEHINNTRRDK